MKKAFLLLVLIVCIQSSFSQHTPKKVIIDCDPGIDDAIALILALESQQLEVIGITTVFGNVRTSQATINAFRILELTNRKLPVYEGAKKPLFTEPGIPPDYVHGKDGLGNIDYPVPEQTTGEMSAAEFMVSTLRENPGEISILTLGPLTNLALALTLEPELADLAAEVVVMGGAVTVPGNVTPVAEANMKGDPHAADIVLTSPMNVSMIGLDVTTRVVINDFHIEQLKNVSQTYGTFIFDISQFYMDFYKSTGVNGMYAHDPTAVAYLIAPDWFTITKAPVRVVTEGIAIGETIMAHNEFTAGQGPWNNKPEVTIAGNVDVDRVLNWFREVLAD